MSPGGKDVDNYISENDVDDTHTLHYISENNVDDACFVRANKISSWFICHCSTVFQ